MLDDPLAEEDDFDGGGDYQSSTIYHVIGPPGCGKTTYLSRTARRAAEVHGSDAVLVASLTRTAAAEAAGRDTGLADHMIGTLHSHAFRSLQMPTIAESKIKEWNAAHPALRRGGGRKDVDELEADLDADDLSQTDVMFSEIEILRHRLVPMDQWPSDLARLYETWRQWCVDNEYVDFTGLIERAIEMVPFAPGRPRVMLGDEAQDWSKLEAKLFRDVWGRRAETVIMVGDPDQAIFSWRGADPRIFLDNPVPDANKRVLRQSYRVPAAVRDAAMRWIENVDAREEVEYDPTPEDGDVRRASFTLKQPDQVVRDVLAHVDAGEDCMLLATCSYMLQPLLHELRDQGLPFWNPYRAKRGDWNPIKVKGGNVYLKGGTMSAADRLLAFFKTDPMVWGDEADPEDYPVVLKAWMSQLRSGDVLRRGMKKVIESGAFAAPVTLEEWERFFVSPEHAQAAMERDLEWFGASLANARQDAFRLPLQIALKSGPGALFKEPQVIVGTIHSVKGGQADNVYIFPDLSRKGMQTWLNDTGDGRDGIVRAFYVALTRARKRVVICEPSARWACHELLQIA